MATFTKRILEVDSYHSPDGEVAVTPERLRHWAKTFKTMSRSKLRIPVAWDHPTDPELCKPQQMSAKSAADTVGWLTDFQVTPDGKAAQITLDIPRSEDASKVKNNLAEVSPVIFKEFIDGKKVTHEDCITHVDLVRHPVDASQSDFVACGIRMGIDTGKPEKFMQKDKAGDPNSFDGDNEEEEDSASDKETSASSDDNEDSDNTNPFAEDSDSDGDDEGSIDDGVPVETDRLAAIIETLQGLDIVLPDGTTAANFFDRFEAALLTRVSMESGEMGTEDLEQSKELAALSLKLKNKATRSDLYMAKTHQAEVNRRMLSLVDSGRCTPDEAKAKSKEIGAIKLSLDSTGTHAPTSVESWITSREAIPKGSCWDGETRTAKMSLDVTTHPQGSTNEETNEEAERIADEVLGHK